MYICTYVLYIYIHITYLDTLSKVCSVWHHSSWLVGCRTLALPGTDRRVSTFRRCFFPCGSMVFYRYLTIIAVISMNIYYNLGFPGIIWDYLGLLLENSWKLLNDFQYVVIADLFCTTVMTKASLISKRCFLAPRRTVQVPLLLCETWFLLDKTCLVVWLPFFFAFHIGF